MSLPVTRPDTYVPCSFNACCFSLGNFELCWMTLKVERTSSYSSKSARNCKNAVDKMLTCYSDAGVYVLITSFCCLPIHKKRSEAKWTLYTECNIIHKIPAAAAAAPSNTFDRVNRTIAIIQECVYSPIAHIWCKNHIHYSHAIILLLLQSAQEEWSWEHSIRHNTTMVAKKNGDKIKRNLNILQVQTFANERNTSAIKMHIADAVWLLLFVFFVCWVAKKEMVCNAAVVE